MESSPESIPQGNRKISDFQHSEFHSSHYYIPKHLKNVVARYIFKKVYIDGEDCLIAFCGKRGRGKTNTAAFLFERLDCTRRGKSRFPLIKKGGKPENYDDIVPSVVYGMNHLDAFWRQMNLIQNLGRDTKGRACIVEEAQNLFNSREFHTRKNMDALKNLLTGRTFGNIYGFTYPIFERVDNQIRELFDLLIEMGPKDAKNGMFRWKAYKLEHKGQGKYFKKFFREKIDGKWYVKSNYFCTPLPSKELCFLIKKKGDIWKSAVRDKRISKDGNILTQEEMAKSGKPSKDEEMEKRALKLATQFRDHRPDFLSDRGPNTGTYSKKLCGMGVDTLGIYVIRWFRRWDREEGIQTEVHRAVSLRKPPKLEA